MKQYTRDTPGWVSLTWQARALCSALLRVVDRAGTVDVGRSGVKGLAALVRIPLEVVAEALPELCEAETVTFDGTRLLLPNFVEAQAAQTSAAERKRRQRETEEAVAALQEPEIPREQERVTRGHAESRVVTIRTEENRSDQKPLPPPAPSVEPQEEEGEEMDWDRVDTLNDIQGRPLTPSEQQEVADVVWKVIQRDKRERDLPVDIQRPEATKERPAFNPWAVAAAKRYGLSNLLWASRQFHDDDSFSASHWATRVFMTEGVYPQRCHPPREPRRKWGYG